MDFSCCIILLSWTFLAVIILLAGLFLMRLSYWLDFFYCVIILVKWDILTIIILLTWTFFTAIILLGGIVLL